MLRVSEKENLLRTIDDMAGEIVELTAEFVKIPTVNPPGENYSRFVELYVKRARKMGLEAKVIDVPGERVERLG